MPYYQCDNCQRLVEEIETVIINGEPKNLCEDCSPNSMNDK